MAQLGRALGLGPRGCRFKSCFPDHLEFNGYNPFFLLQNQVYLGKIIVYIVYIAQLEEHFPPKEKVISSNLIVNTIEN